MPKKPSLLSHIPPPLLAELIDGRWLPIVGAGLSMNADVVDPKTPLPNWEKLGELIGSDLPTGYSANGPLETVSAYEHAYGRPRLVDAFMKALQVGTATPGRVHRAFCSIPFETVVTTNVEQLLEAEYRANHGSVLSITDEQQLRLVNPYGAPTLVKLRRFTSPLKPRAVGTGLRCLRAEQAPICNLAGKSTHRQDWNTGIGYSLEDADFRQILALLTSRLGESGPDLYVVEAGADPVRVDRYERRGVRVINLPRTPAGYGIFANFFQEVHEYWVERFASTLTGTTSTVRALLRAGQRSENAVFFLVDDRSLSLYDEYVFSRLVAVGLIPLTVQDVSHPPGYRVATVEALMRISAMVILDDDNPSAPAALRFTASVGSTQVLRVKAVPESTEGDPAWLFELGYAPRPRSVDEWESFGSALTQFLTQSATARVTAVRDARWSVSESTHVSEADLGSSTRAQVTLGLIDLESRIRRELPESAQRVGGRPAAGFRQTLQLAQQSLNIELDSETRDLLVVARNSLIHGNRSFSSSELNRLRAIVRDIMLQLP